MTNSQIKLGFVLLAAQIVMLAMTLAFKACMDVQAQRNGIDTIIMEAGK